MERDKKEVKRISIMSSFITKVKKSYEHTIYASYMGYITQAIVNNFAPLLFLTFVQDYGLSLEQITLITTINFAVQLTVIHDDGGRSVEILACPGKLV